MKKGGRCNSDPPFSMSFEDAKAAKNACLFVFHHLVFFHFHLVIAIHLLVEALLLAFAAFHGVLLTLHAVLALFHGFVSFARGAFVPIRKDRGGQQGNGSGGNGENLKWLYGITPERLLFVIIIPGRLRQGRPRKAVYCGETVKLER